MNHTERKPVIEFKDFSFQYFSQAEPTLHDINLTIYEGEKVLLVGPSGSGKSTLGNCLNGLIPFASPCFDFLHLFVIFSRSLSCTPPSLSAPQP